MINRAGLTWLLLGLIWGTNFFFMKWSTKAATPMQVELVRGVAGFLTVATSLFFAAVILDNKRPNATR